MPERGQLAVRGRRQPHALVRIGPAVDIVEQLLPRHRDLHRPADPLRGDRRRDGFRPQHLAAESAADVRREDADLVRLYPHRSGENLFRRAEDLQTRMQRQPIAIP